MMGSTVAKRSIVLMGHKTSVSLEAEFWEGLRRIAGAQKTTLSNLLRQIDEGRQAGNLSSAIRVFVLNNLRADSPRSSTIDEEKWNGRTAGARYVR